MSEGPTISYLICGSQRSGTTLLATALASTGVAGRPEEYFLSVDEKKMPEWRCWERGPFGVAHGATSREDYLRIVSRLGTTPNGVFGSKLHWNNVPWAVAKFQELPRFAGLSRAGVLHRAFPGLQAVHLTRRDRVAQAVSWARAARDGVWTDWVDRPSPVRPPPPQYDATFIANLEGLIAEGERGWRELFVELGVEPLDLEYEELVTDDRLDVAVRRVLDHLGINHAQIGPVRPGTRRLADGVNEEWAARYRSETAAP
ncbi:MAG: Stf0 family sulfotransferase [Acidimicrobiales bacterium]